MLSRCSTYFQSIFDSIVRRDKQHHNCRSPMTALGTLAQQHLLGEVYMRIFFTRSGGLQLRADAYVFVGSRKGLNDALIALSSI